MRSKAMIASTLSPPFFYGKLPAHGDFISRGVSRDTLKLFDKWLAEILTAAKDAWQDSFKENYYDAQPWLFSGGDMIAVLIPSFDRVERLFPLFVVHNASIRIQDLYDASIMVITNDLSGDDLFESMSELCPASEQGDALGWFRPDENELALPHPFSTPSGKQIETLIQ